MGRSETSCVPEADIGRKEEGQKKGKGGRGKKRTFRGEEIPKMFIREYLALLERVKGWLQRRGRTPSLSKRKCGEKGALAGTGSGVLPLRGIGSQFGERGEGWNRGENLFIGRKGYKKKKKEKRKSVLRRSRTDSS